MSAKIAVEMTLVAEAHLISSLRHPIVSTAQQFMRFLHPRADQVTIRRQPGRPLEEPDKMKGTQMRFTGQILDENSFLQMRVNIIGHIAQLPWRQAAILPGVAVHAKMGVQDMSRKDRSECFKI